MDKRIYLLLLVLFCLGLLCSCAPGVNSRSADNRAGFFMGIWHGWIAPVTLIWQLFNSNVRIYEIFNTGWSYDLGYYLGVVGGFGGLALSRRKKICGD